MTPPQDGQDRPPGFQPHRRHPIRTVTTTIELNASPEEIWQVLTDTAAHSDWNPFITELLVPGRFDGAHSFTLEPLPDGRTRLVQRETFRGALVWFARHLLQNTEAGCTAMNEALGQQVAERNPV